MARLHMSAPWVVFYREIEALFAEDAQVHVIYDEDNDEVRLYVDSQDKADALMELLPTEKVFGNVTLKITIIPANTSTVGGTIDEYEEEVRKYLVQYVTADSKAKETLYEQAFDGNCILSYVKTVHGIFTNDITYVVFQNKVVQYFNDDLSDVNGQCSTLYQEIAKDVFKTPYGVYYCTDVPHPVLGSSCSLGRPLGEWP